MDTAATILSLLLAVAFLGAGIPKLLRTERFRTEVRRWRLPDAALPVIGLVEVVAAGLLIAGVVADSAGPALVGALILVAAMVGAVATHLRIGDPPPLAAPPAVLGVLAAVTAVLLA